MSEKTTASLPGETVDNNKEDVAIVESRTVALEFAQSLIKGDIEKATEYLSQQLKPVYPLAVLKQDFEELAKYVEGEIKEARLGEEAVEWYKKKKDEIYWVYVWLNGDTFSEGMQVLTCKDTDGSVRIKALRWGR